jgi:hypothetical protein
MIKEIVMAGFSINKSNSLFYKRYKTVKGFLKGLEIGLDLSPDYISIRIIKVNPRESYDNFLKLRDQVESERYEAMNPKRD